MARYRQFSAPRERFPWLIFLALLGSIYLFWILPRQMGDQPVRVEFTEPASKNP